MKKNPKLLEMMNNIDEKYIEEAEKAKFLPQKNIWKRVGSIAASLALVAAIGTFPFWGNLNQPEIGPEIPNGTTNETTNKTEDFVYLYADYVWDSKQGIFKSYTESATTGNSTNESRNPSLTVETTTTVPPNKEYPHLTGLYEDYIRARMGINKAYVGEFLSDITIQDEDGNTSPAQMYRLKSIDPKYAVCIQYSENTERYSTYYNPNVTFETFSDFKNAYSLEEHLYIGDGLIVNYNYQTKTETLTQPNGSYLNTVRYRILQADGKSCTYDEFLQNLENYERVGMQACHGEMRCFDSGLQVFADGYLMTNLGGTVQIFDIGKESAESIISAAKILEKEVGCFYFYDDERDILSDTVKHDSVSEPPVGTAVDGMTGLTTPSYDPHKTKESEPYAPADTVLETVVEETNREEPLYGVNQPSYEGHDPYAWTTTEETMVYETNPLIYEGDDPYAWKR